MAKKFTPVTNGHHRAVGRPRKDGNTKLDELISKEITDQIAFSSDLSDDQIDIIMKSINSTLKNYKINSIETGSSQDATMESNTKILNDYIASKRVEAKSPQTLYNYSNEISKMLQVINKPIQDIDATDIRRYMDFRKEKDGVSNTTIHNIRMYLLSFYKYLIAEEIVTKNPMLKIAPIKTEKRVVETLTDEEQEMIRCACTNERDLAIIDLLSGSGMRVSELVGLNRQDVNFETGELKVFGKGSKERICYLTGRAKVHLKWYLESRTDDNDALFVTTKSPYARLGKNGIEYILKNVAKNSKVPRLHLYPHKYRSTLATNMINKGASAESVQNILGHQSVDTTLQCYTSISKDTIKQVHKAYA